MGSSPSVAARPLPRALRLPAPLLLLGWVVVASALQLVRAPGIPAWRVMWAEDATVFLSQALDRSFPEALGTTYAGYLHIVPRLIVEPAALLPLSAAAAVVAINSAVVVSLLAAYVWVAARSVFETRLARALLVALFVFAPQTLIEIGGTASNYHWYGMLASFFAFLHRPASRREAAAATAVVGFTALSDPMLALLLPLLVLRPGGLLRSQLGARAIPAAALCGLAAQALAVLTSSGPESVSAFSPLDLPAIYAQRVAGPAVLGDSWFGQLWLSAGWAAAWVALAIVAGLAVHAARSGSAPQRRHALLAAAGSLVLFSVPLAIRGTTEMAPIWATCSRGGARYTHAPLVLAWVPALLLVDRRGAWAARLATLVVVIVVASTTGHHRPQPRPRLGGPARPGSADLRRGERRGHPRRPALVSVGGRPLLRSHPRVSAFIRSGHSRAPAGAGGLPMTNQTPILATLLAAGAIAAAEATPAFGSADKRTGARLR